MKLRIHGYSVLENIMGEKNNQWWGWGLDKEISRSFSDYLSLMLGKPRIRLNNLKTSLRFPCRGLNPIIDSINIMRRCFVSNRICFPRFSLERGSMHVWKAVGVLSCLWHPYHFWYWVAPTGVQSLQGQLLVWLLKYYTVGTLNLYFFLRSFILYYK